MRHGRPLWFLGTVLLGWTGIRAAILWHATPDLPGALGDMAPLRPAFAVSRRTIRHLPAEVAGGMVIGPPFRPSRPGQVVAHRGRPLIEDIAIASAPPVTSGGEASIGEAVPGTIAPAPVAAPSPVADAPALPPRWNRPPAPAHDGPSRWSASGWLIARSGTGLGASPDAPQLGGSQGGIRIDYALSRTVAVTGRLAAPAAGAGREASLGLAWRPAGVPLRFVVEQRFALDRGRGGAALGVSGGVSDVALPARFRLEGYAQAGLIVRDGIEHYADGIVRAARPIGAAGGLAFDLGAGAWGGVQRGVSRLDAGPSIGARLPVAGRAVRVALDWRQRVAGNARPGSGPALAIGADF